MKKWGKRVCILLAVVISLNVPIPARAYTPDLCTGGTPIGDMQSGGLAFDNNPATAASPYSQEKRSGHGDNAEWHTVTYCSVGYDLTTPKKVRLVQVLAATSVPITFYYADENLSWVKISSGTLSANTVSTFVLPDIGAHRYWQIMANTAVYEIEMRDSTSPIVSVSSPVGNSAFNNQPNNYTMVLRGTVDCPFATSTVYYNIDGGATQTVVGTVKGTSSFNDTPIDLSNFSVGNHTLNVWAVDESGQPSVTSSIPFSYSVVPSAFTILSPTKDQSFSSKAPYNIINISGSVSNPGWTSMVYYNIDGGATQTGLGAVNGTGNFQTVTINPQTISEGAHTLNIWSVDNRNRTSNTTSIPFKVDFTAPNITSLSAISASDSLNIYADANDPFGLHKATAYQATVTPSSGGNPIVSGWKAVSPITIAGLKPDTLYTIKMEVQDSAGNISEKTITKYTSAQIPSLSVKNAAGTAEITMLDGNPATTKYKIMCESKFVDQTGHLTTTPSWVTLTDKKISVVGLSPNSSYSFRATAMGSDGVETAPSDMKTVDKIIPLLSAPTEIKALSKSNEIQISWAPVDGATGYKVCVDGKLDAPIVVTDPYYIHSNLEVKSAHKYQVWSLNKEGKESEQAAEISATTAAALPVAPGNFVITPFATTAELKWDPVIGAISYEVLADGVVKDMGNKVRYVNRHLSPDTIHTYSVRAKNAAGYSPWTEVQVVRTTMNIPAIPMMNFNKISNTQITVAWDEMADAEGYDVEVDGVINDCGIYNFCLKSYLSPLSTHVFRIRAKNAIGESPWSQPVTLSTFLLDTPQNVSVIEEDTKMNLKWKAVTDGERYILSVNGVETDMGNVLEYTVKDLVPETEYRVKIKAISSKGTGNWSDERIVHSLPTRPTKPQNISLLVVPNYVSLTWDKVEGATGYDVELDGVMIDNDNSNTYIDEALEPNTVHNFRVRAKNTAIEGEWSDNKVVTTLNALPTAPSAIQISTTKSIATITWEKLLGAIGYSIEVDGVETVMGDNNVYTHRRLVEGAEHRYRIRSKFINGMSPWTGEIINNSILAICKKGKTVDLGLTAQDVTDFSKYTLTVTYDPKAISVVDLCTLSSGIELAPGKVKGTDIQITEFTPGKIVFVTSKVVNFGESWTGVINSIKFNAKVSGRTAITYTVFTAPDVEE